MKKKLTIIIVSILIFLFFNFLGGWVIGRAGQTNMEILLGYLMFAAYGLVFGLIFIFVDWILARKGK